VWKSGDFSLSFGCVLAIENLLKHFIVALLNFLIWLSGYK